jgi:hypothetical protein
MQGYRTSAGHRWSGLVTRFGNTREYNAVDEMGKFGSVDSSQLQTITWSKLSKCEVE